jgi:hypothetical protein
MDSSRTWVLVTAGLALAGTFVMGILGASMVIGEVEEKRAREASAVYAELDQLQNDLEDLDSRLKVIEAELRETRRTLEDLN